MPRPQLIRTSHFAYHITVRSNNKEWFYIPHEVVWEFVLESLSKASDKYGAHVHLCVLMSNHLHVILVTPNANLDDVMRYFLSITTSKIQKCSGRINHVFGGRYKWSLLEDAEALSYVYKYVARNPVRAGIVATVEDYPFSTISGVSSLPIVEGFNSYWSLIPKRRELRLAWLNLPSPKEQEALIKLGLRRFRFKFTTCSNKQAALRSLRQVYQVSNDPIPFNT